jgi:murein DD-endopeptidase MepM/ murein hydrolase activator NlpD
MTIRFRISRILEEILSSGSTTALAVVALALILPATAAAKAILVNEDNPFQVRISEQVADMNHTQESYRALASEKQTARPEAAGSTPLLQLPLRRGFVNDNPGFYGISNFVDQDMNLPDMLLDYNCGDRTYDTATFNHNGIDYLSSVYSRWTMENEGLIGVAAADGTIIFRRDGEPDMNCDFSRNDGNEVVLEHADGTVTVYAHFKKETVTPRRVGDTVEAGDYLGVIGSSGLSTGPHLHLGVQDSAGNLLDPNLGDCNALNSEGLWANQEPYVNKTLNALATHDAAPENPPCPQVEVPHFEDQFMPGDTVFFSAFARDFTGEDTIALEIRDPMNQVIVQLDFAQEDIGFAGTLTITFSVEFTTATPSGAFTFAAAYAGQSLEHTFYMNSGPDPLPEAVVGNNAYNGLFYDRLLDGEGYNFVAADGGTIIYFYGSDVKGNRLWLISDLIYGPISDGQEIVIAMYESTGGTFGTPVASARGLSFWGTLTLVFSDCNSGTATLRGIDGNKVSNIVKLASVAGTNCSSGDIPPDAGLSGLHFDTGKDGEGYNLVVASVGSILYFYGFKVNGLRLWLISDLITQVLAQGVAVVTPMFEATQGVFDTPVPSSEALVQWGTATITVIDCDHITIVLEGSDGSKTSNTIRLAGIIGLSCS